MKRQTLAAMACVLAAAVPLSTAAHGYQVDGGLPNTVYSGRARTTGWQQSDNGYVAYVYSSNTMTGLVVNCIGNTQFDLALGTRGEGGVNILGGPRAQHIESFVERPVSRKRETALGREIDYPKIDQGRTRRERNAQIIDLNLERRARSPDLETRIFAQFERGQRQLDVRLERALAEQARSRTRDERRLKAEFRGQLRVVADARRGAYLEGVTTQREHLEVRIKSMRTAHQAERASLHEQQNSFWARLCRAVDITGGTRRKRQEARRALVAEHRKARGALARESRGEWLALKDAVAKRFAPEHDGLVRQRRQALSALKEKHARADAMADAKRQLREAHRERDRLRTVEMVRTLRDDESVRTKQVSARGLTKARADRAFSEAQRTPLPFTRKSSKPRDPSRDR